jgi:hypothetical protein
MLKIKDIKKFSEYNQVINFMSEFIYSMKEKNLNFDEFMVLVYGGVDEFKKNNLNDLEEDYKNICKIVDNYSQIVDLVEKVSDGNE